MRIGVDVGGTFTDIVATDGTGSVLFSGKLLASSAAESMLEGIDQAMARTKTAPGAVELVVHATTRGTNALLESRGARLALICTAGFRDVLELARGRRPSLYDLQFDKPTPLIPRDRRLEVRERMDHTGEVLLPLDDTSIQEVIAKLRSMKDPVEAIAICLLNSYANPTHEQQLSQKLKEAFSDLLVISSHEVLQEPKEFERTTTTVICAYLAPLLTAYLDQAVSGLTQREMHPQFYVMHSAGGVVRPADVPLRAHTLVESGPAAGVLAAQRLLQTQFEPSEAAGDFVSFDMGGTTAKACLIRKGQIAVTMDYEVGMGAHGQFAVKLSGYPIRTPVIDLVESGQGGGSIAWVDAVGVLKVGPRSAGANPGPVCYGLGGELPTITDCNLVLGRLDPMGFAGGSMNLYPDKAYNAIEVHLARPLGIDVPQAAAGVLRVANAAMARSIRVISVQRGVSPEGVALIAFGGAGPLHAAELAAELGISTLIVPPEPGVFSAAGLLAGDLSTDFSCACNLRCQPASAKAIQSLFEGLAERAAAWIEGQGYAMEQANLLFQADARYVGQSHTISIAAQLNSSASELVSQIRKQFDASHLALYTFANPDSEVEIVICRVVCSAPVVRQSGGVRVATPSEVTARKPARQVYFAGLGFVETWVAQRTQLLPGETITGPGVIEEQTSTTVVPPGWRCLVRPNQLLELSRAGQGLQ